MRIPLYKNYGKRFFDLLTALIILVISWPFLLLIGLIIKLDSKGPVIFSHNRAGKNGQPFRFYKFRTMVNRADKLKVLYQNKNEADGPVFKIRNDPRFTRAGKVLSHSGLDELPQLFNVLAGQMSLVGPRPLPLDEEEKIPLKWRQPRRTVKPGITSSWVNNGTHQLNFTAWMAKDLKDIQKSSFTYDLRVIAKSIAKFPLMFLNSIFKYKNIDYGVYSQSSGSEGPARFS